MARRMCQTERRWAPLAHLVERRTFNPVGRVRVPHGALGAQTRTPGYRPASRSRCSRTASPSRSCCSRAVSASRSFCSRAASASRSRFSREASTSRSCCSRAASASRSEPSEAAPPSWGWCSPPGGSAALGAPADSGASRSAPDPEPDVPAFAPVPAPASRAIGPPVAAWLVGCSLGGAGIDGAPSDARVRRVEEVFVTDVPRGPPPRETGRPGPGDGTGACDWSVRSADAV